eukprot:3661563-Pleurochrysis_carterae.AAC.1
MSEARRERCNAPGEASASDGAAAPVPLAVEMHEYAFMALVESASASAVEATLEATLEGVAA